MVDNVTTPVPAGKVLALKDIGGALYALSLLVDPAGADVMGAVTANPAAFTALGRLKAITDAIDADRAAVQAMAPYLDGLEGLITSTNTALGQLAGYSDGVEGLIGATNALLTSLGQYTDGLEALLAPTATAVKQDEAKVVLASILASNAPFGGRVAMTVGIAVTPGRAIEIVASAAGNVALTFADGSTTVVAIAAGTTILDYAVTTVTAAGTTATATYGKLL